MEKTDLNSKNKIQDRASSGQVSWQWPLMLVFARLLFAFIAQSLIAVLFFSASPRPYQAASDWWPVYGIFIDVCCFLLIKMQIKKENLHFRDLFSFDIRLLKRDILAGLGYILWVFPLAMTGLIGFSLLLFANPQPPSIYHPLPLWAVAYSLFIFPVVWGTMEQCTYQGYALPRLDALLRRPGLAIGIVVFGWGIQHVALPFIADWRYLLYRFLSFLPLAIVMALVYLRTRRLIPFVVAHWAVDMLGILSGMIVPMLTA